MKLNLHKQAVALAVLVVIAGPIANAQSKVRRGGVTTTETRTSSKATATQSQQQAGKASTQAAPATGGFRQSRVSFGAKNSAQTQAAPATRTAPTAARRQAPATRSADAALPQNVKDVMAAIDKAGLDGSLNGKSAKLGEALAADASLLAMAESILKDASAKPQNSKLNSARIEGLLTIASLSKQVRDTDANLVLPKDVVEQSFVALVQNAGREANGMSESTQTSVLTILQSANNHIIAGMTVEQAMIQAQKDLKAATGVDVKLEDIRKLCRKA